MANEDAATFDIATVNEKDDLRIDQPLVRYDPKSHEWGRLPHKYGAADPLGLWQFDFVRAQGVEPGDIFLEIGPGGFRLAQHLVPFLNPRRYYAVEVSRQALDWGWNLLSPEARAKQPKLFWGGDFDFEPLDISPQFVWAHSVLTHLSWNHIGKCLHEVRKIIAPQGAFFATYFRCHGEMWKPQTYGPPGKRHSGKHLSYGDRDPYHYTLDLISDLARRTGWSVSHIDLPNHSKGQSLLRFTP